MAAHENTAGRHDALVLWERAEDLHRMGLAREPEPWEDGLRETPRPGSFEWWYFDADCDDGTSVVIVFETKALAASAGSLAPRLSLTIRTPGGRVHASRTHYDPAAFLASRDHCDVTLGPHRVRGDLTQYSIYVRTPSATADLTLTAIAPPSRVGTGTVELKDDPTQYLGWLVAVPRGTVAGRLTVHGQTWEIRGVGYHDKNWGTMDYGSVLKEWHWARAHAGEFSVTCAELRALPDHRGSRAGLFILTQGNSRLAATGTGISFTPHTPAHPTADIRWADRATLTLGEAQDLSPSTGSRLAPYRRFTAPAQIDVGHGPGRQSANGTATAEHALFLPTAPAACEPPSHHGGGRTSAAFHASDLTDPLWGPAND
ncbi:lipocalin-like domain-containing protein [Streptomyces subrutilus]|uniref:Diels-Alderase N-terminal domain-containing protein n=1 Tax=Streptomyces subrutilus TaxID=36818 RepID=A0A1E5PKH6_9ACTN|nr:lipocalin-like domain-containing protein [Streptomyces subrutilus]OEJ30030.1 hypothetical protein BGK67_00270 [Streptomyces subrutilus]